MTVSMDQRIVRMIVVGLAVGLFTAYQVASNRNPASGSTSRLTPEIRARTLTFAPEVDPADRAWVLAAIAKARPEAQELIAAVDGLVTIRMANVTNAPWVGLAQPVTDDVELNRAYLDGDRKQDRDVAVLHELGHIVDFELIPDAEMRELAAELPSSGTCFTAEVGDCTAPEERFADTFAKWALRGAVSSAGSGYGLLSPASLEDWGAPLGLLAAEQTVAQK
jgi:hypothetical protein